MQDIAPRPTRRPSFGLAAYRLATRAVGPAIPFLLSTRLKRGKEDPARLPERMGIAARARPEGALVWFHAASIGEALSILPLIDGLLSARADLHVLVTTGTVTSSRLMAERLPPRAFHQFVPLDHPDYCARFLDHWRPDIGVWVESEFWPNLIVAADARGMPLALINARITEASFRGWRRFPATIADLVGRFSAILAQDGASAQRLRTLGAAHVATPGNLKHDALPLGADEAEVAALRRQIGGRALWLATNTHEGEEVAAAEVHIALRRERGDLLTLIVPRHPARGDAIAGELARRGLDVARRSLGQTITPQTQVYLADTLGELGLFYRLADIVFIGGTLSGTGGHNPYEAARLHCALIAGPSSFNFTEAFADFETADAMIRIADADGLARAVSSLLADKGERERRAEAAFRIASTTSGALGRTLDALLGLLPNSSGAPARRAQNA
ncbi:MAG: 3-deoxy-D-manno-octulosonic acid transferase [Parvibaculum sp.]|jgi:3-deoxy-D-manno-octulosonic-acid transferase|uniref:3-deoxy-D-manno-octulosonic acid transferase n=1 Tax=Parvibaculum sp. TaxID=2024848 RepID=UPI00283AE94C|nr:3-deoxy-D-manno-octulosonic acid transferase [Parvibaculum sp.]MDR3498320.1 3-deoxy-D-manno-octulosonic acid transferase [Parvibaculum sp.]